MEEGSRKRLFVESALSGNSSALGSDFFSIILPQGFGIRRIQTCKYMISTDKCFVPMYLIACARSMSNRDMQEI